MRQDLPTSLQLRVITPHKLLVDKEVKAVSLPTLEGHIGILPGHRPLVTALGKGMITYLMNRGEEAFSVKGGFAEIFPDKVLVFTKSSKEEAVGVDEG